MASKYYVKVYRRIGTKITKERVSRRDLQSAEKFLEGCKEYPDIMRAAVCKRSVKRDTVIKVWAKGLA